MSRTSASFSGVAYANGKIPSSLLGKLDGKHGSSMTLNAYLRKDAAASFNRARAEIKKAHGETLSVRGWYRTYAEQVKFYTRPHSAAVAVPGYSNHGLGLAIDVSNFGGVGQFNNARRKKMISILKKHGWTEDEGRRVNEPWHLVYSPAKDKGKGSAAKPAGAKRKPLRPLTIRQGSTKGRIHLLQEVLKHTGDYTGKVDAKFGPTTDAAVKRFQKRVGLVADGIVGPKTWFRLIQGIRKGTKGPRVKLLQLICGMSGKGITGEVGNVTVSNMKKVQRWLGVTADGDFGPKTIAALMRKG